MSADSSSLVVTSPKDSVEPQINGDGIKLSTGGTPGNIVKDVGAVENGQVPSPSQEDPPALVSTTVEATNNKEMSVGVNSSSNATPMEIEDKDSDVSHSDRGDSPDLVIVTQSEEEAPAITSRPVEREGEISGEEIDPNVPLEESSDDDNPPHPHTSHSHPHQDRTPHSDHTPHLKYVASSPVNGSSILSMKSHQDVARTRRSGSPGHRTKQVAKLKQFFTTLQGFGNKLGSEAAEQVQELITALVVSLFVCA